MTIAVSISGMSLTVTSKMQVNMYCVVLFLLLVVSWVQSQSQTSSLSAVSAFNTVTTKKSGSASITTSIKHENSPNTTTTATTSTLKSTIIASTSMTHASSPNTTTTATTSTLKPTIIASTSITHASSPNTTTMITSTTSTSSPNMTTTATTDTTHKISLSTTPTATNSTKHQNNQSTITTATTGTHKLTTKTSSGPKTNSRTQTPGTTTTSSIATSTAGMTALGEIYINEVMVDNNGVLLEVELFVTAEANVSHFTLASFEETLYMLESHQLNPYQLNDRLLTVSLNKTQLDLNTMKSVGIALYDTNLWTNNNTLSNTAGLVDALVIATSFESTSARLVQTLTPECLPIVLQLKQIDEHKSITRCSMERACNSSMFMYISSSFGKNNCAICENRFNYMDTMTLKINCTCQTCGGTNQGEIIRYLIQEIDKICQCELTALHISDSYIACCGGTALHATIVAADNEQKNKMMTAYKMLLLNATTVTLGHNNYSINKECSSFCCHPTSSKTEPKIKLTVAVSVTCIVVFLVIMIFVVLYARRKKRSVNQFSMIRLDEDNEDDDLIMAGTEDDNFVGGQDATFYKNSLVS